MVVDVDRMVKINVIYMYPPFVEVIFILLVIVKANPSITGLSWIEFSQKSLKGLALAQPQNTGPKEKPLSTTPPHPLIQTFRTLLVCSGIELAV